MTDEFFSGYPIQHEREGFIHDYHADFMSVCAGAEMPEEIDPRKWYRIEMQSSMSSCVGHGLSGVIESDYRDVTGQIQHFSRMHCYLLAQEYSDKIMPGYNFLGRDAGALIEGAVAASLEQGPSLEKTFPYPGHYTTKIPAGANDEGKKYLIRSASYPKNYDEAMTYLGTHQGKFLVGAPWPFRLSSGFTMTEFRSYGRSGHAWCILGYLKDGRLIAANSHDVTFADEGFFYIDKRGFNEMVNTRNVVVAGLSDLTTPKPRKVDYKRESMFL